MVSGRRGPGLERPLRALDYARPLPKLSFDADIHDAGVLFGASGNQTHVAVTAGARFVGLLSRRQVEEAASRSSGSSRPRRIPVATLRFEDHCRVDAGCPEEELRAEIERWRNQREGSGGPALVVVMDGVGCAGLIHATDLEGLGAVSRSVDRVRPVRDRCETAGDISPEPRPGHLQAFLECCSVPSALFDATLQLRYANPAFIALAELASGGVAGWHWSDLFEEPLPDRHARTHRGCAIPCSAAHALTLRRTAVPGARVEADVDGVDGGRMVLVTIRRCVKGGMAPFQGCFCRRPGSRFQVGDQAAPLQPDTPNVGGANEGTRAFAGDLGHFRLIETLQFLVHAQKTGTLKICPTGSGAESGEIVFRGGDLRHAVHGGWTGKEALRSLCDVSSGSFHFEEGDRNVPVTMEGSPCAILLSVCTGMDEARVEETRSSTST